MSYSRMNYQGGPSSPSRELDDQENPFLSRQDPRYNQYHQPSSPSPAPYTETHYPSAQNNPMSPVSPPTQHPQGFNPRSPSPGMPLQQQQHGYQMEDMRQYDQRHLEIPMGPGPGPGYLSPSDRLQGQPTYSLEDFGNSYEYEGRFTPAQYNAQAQHPQQQQQGGYALNPEDHHNAYYNQSYEPTPDHEYPPSGNQGYWHDENDAQPILHADTAYGPDPHTLEDQQPGQYTGDYTDHPESQPPNPPQPSGTVKRWKTVKSVPLFNGNFVLDCPIPPRLLNQIEHAPPPERDEYTHMRYTAATCDPKNFFDEGFTLRQRLFSEPRKTELFIVVTMYNEEDELFARTMMGIIKNIEHMNSRTSSKTWGKSAWKKIVVCVVSDGRAKINPRTRAVLAAMGVYQEGIAKQEVKRKVNGQEVKKDVTAHIYEYTTQMTLELKKGIVNVKRGNTPVQMLFCLKEKNQKKINSHRWFFQAFGTVLQPNICVLIDAGTKPGKTSIYQLWKCFDIEPRCAGACGEIKAQLNSGRKLLNPLIAAQNFEYKMSNILDKPLESVFGFISVLPGAFSAYRYHALQNDKTGQGPLEKYFKGETMHGANAGIFTANMYLAEDRILCFELVAKRNSEWVLTYVKSAEGETDVMEDMPGFISQRRRWLNGSFFAAVYAITHFYQIFRSSHSCLRKFFFLFEFVYQAISMLFAWFGIGNFFLVFRILTTSLGDPDLLGTAGRVLAVVFEWLYLVTLVSCFVLSLGNRPQGSAKLYMTMVWFWVVLMAYLMFAAIYITVVSVKKQVDTPHFTVSDLFNNSLFFTLIVSMASTYLLYFVMSFLFFDPWHMFTSFIQYILLTPTYINILNVYAFCNTHDITWGTKGEDKAAVLPSAKVKADGAIDHVAPSDAKDLNEQYEEELLTFQTKYTPPEKIASAEDIQADYYKGIRSAVVLFWMFCNLALAAVVLNTGGFETIKIQSNAQAVETQRSTIYMSVILWSVAGLALVRAIGSFWFLILRLLRGV